MWQCDGYLAECNLFIHTWWSTVRLPTKLKKFHWLLISDNEMMQVMQMWEWICISLMILYIENIFPSLGKGK